MSTAEPPSPSVAPDADPASGWRRAVAAVAPQGPLQVAVAVVVLAFLAGAVGYFVGTRDGRPTSDLDAQFLYDMSDHHDQAVTMAACAVSNAASPTVKDFAKEVLIFQNRELGIMDTWLAEQGKTRPSEEDRTAMAWMGMPTKVASMPGMATDDEMAALCKATGTEADRQFLTLMRAHHEGGIHMAEVAAEKGADPRVKDFADTVARNQRVEVNEYTGVMKQLGYQ